jgi:DNA-binding beta-propeller fold protein YncE
MTLYKHFKDLGVDQIIYSAHTPDGKYILAPCPYDSKVLVINFETGKVVKRLQSGKAPINVQITPCGERAFVSNALDDHVSVIDLKTFEIKDFCKALKPNGMGFAVLPQN